MFQVEKPEQFRVPDEKDYRCDWKGIRCKKYAVQVASAEDGACGVSS